MPNVKLLCLISILIAFFSSDLLANDMGECVDKRFTWIGANASNDSFYIDMKDVSAIIRDTTGHFNKLNGAVFKGVDNITTKGLSWIVLDNGTKFMLSAGVVYNIEEKLRDYHTYLKTNPGCAMIQ